MPDLYHLSLWYQRGSELSLLRRRDREQANHTTLKCRNIYPTQLSARDPYAGTHTKPRLAVSRLGLRRIS